MKTAACQQRLPQRGPIGVQSIADIKIVSHSTIGKSENNANLIVVHQAGAWYHVPEKAAVTVMAEPEANVVQANNRIVNVKSS
jgi:hypothetical protein